MPPKPIRPGPSGHDLRVAIEDAAKRGITKTQLAKELGLEVHTMLAREKAYNNQVPKGAYPFSFEYGKAWELKGDWIIVGDVHIPMTNTEFAMYPALIAEKHLTNPRLIIAGDLFNMDTFSSFAQIVNLPTWQEERIGAKRMVDAWLKTFSQIYILMGNHERRLQRFTMGMMDEGDILALISAPKERVRMSGFSYCTIATPTGTWRVTHPKNYSQNARTVANKLAQKHRQHIVSFHEHHTAMSMDDSGQNMVINVGGLVDGISFPYVSLEDNTKPVMKKSFLMLKGGYPYLFSDTMTDWQYWL